MEKDNDYYAAKAAELFPPSLFEPLFQKDLYTLYCVIMEAVAAVCSPVKNFNPAREKWNFIYRYIFESNGSYKLQFSAPELLGFIEIVPRKEQAVANIDEMFESFRPSRPDSKNELITVIAGVQPSSPKFFRRKIRFVSLEYYLSLLDFLFKSEYEDKKYSRKKRNKNNGAFFRQIDDEFVELVMIINAANQTIFADKPKNSLLVVEDNKIFQRPMIVSPESAQFKKLIKFGEKIKEMLAEMASKKQKQTIH